jgi:hypothetical protein
MDCRVDLGSIPRETLALVAAVAVTVALLQALGLWARRLLRRRKLSIRMERAVRGEERAGTWLRDLGYEVLGAQVVAEHPVRVDGRTVTITLRADYLVARDGTRYVVEVKTGALAPRIETSATRRQILEYRIAFDVDGVLLVDGETGRVHEVSFPSLERSAPPKTGSWRLVALVLVAAAGVLAVLRFG